MKLEPEEIEARMKKTIMLRRLPLEQTKTYINGPLYGLTEDVFGLQHSKHIWQFENCIRLEYLSPRYEQYRYKDDQTFIVTTCLFGEDEELPAIPLILCPSCTLKAGQQFMIVHHPDGRTLGGDLPGLDQCHRLVANDTVLTIDGKSFKGNIIHYTEPVRFSRFILYNERIKLDVEALGPSIEELIQIVESLHDLNGKEVE
jgi:hypothetical protein